MEEEVDFHLQREVMKDNGWLLSFVFLEQRKAIGRG